MLSAIFYIISYFFDCLDGYYARKYDMTSKFGDFYDHISDLSKVILLFIAMYHINKNKASKVIIISLIFSILLGIHLGCQEKFAIFTKNNMYLASFKKFCPCDNKNIMKYTKWFGCGTLVLIHVIGILYYYV